MIHKLISIYDLISEVNPKLKCDTNTAMILKSYRVMNVCSNACWHVHITLNQTSTSKSYLQHERNSPENYFRNRLLNITYHERFSKVNSCILNFQIHSLDCWILPIMAHQIMTTSSLITCWMAATVLLQHSFS